MTSRYPTVPRGTSTQLAAEFLRSGERHLRSDEIQWQGAGPEVDLADWQRFADAVPQLIDKYEHEHGNTDRDLLEGQLAGYLHRILRGLPTQVLDDPGFWRYVTFVDLWAFVVWREAERFDKGPGTYVKYVDGINPTECVATRMYLRGQAVRDGDDYSLAVIPKATDFYRSHLLRVSVGAAPAVARAFAREHKAERMPTDQLRDFARRLNRHATNLVLPILTDDEGRDLIRELTEAGSTEG